jgi:hypothetical protein
MKEINGKKYFGWEEPIKKGDIAVVRALIKIDNINFMERRDPITLLYTKKEGDVGIEFLVCDLGQYLVKRYPNNIMGSQTYGRNVISVLEIDWDRNTFMYSDFLGMLFDANTPEQENYIENLFHIYEL